MWIATFGPLTAGLHQPMVSAGHVSTVQETRNSFFGARQLGSNLPAGLLKMSQEKKIKKDGARARV